jgi:hypothetical protein
MPAILASFALPIITALGALVGVAYWLGPTALLTAVLLIVLEITLSFDNAVVNAQVLKHMSALWQRAFLTWGIFIAVFGTRFLLPILIVAAVAWASPWEIGKLALLDPIRYGELLDNARFAIYAFGASFLLMVALKYFLDDTKTVHWFHVLEEHLTLWGRIEAVEIALGLSVVTGVSFVSEEMRATVLTAGVVGVILFVLMQGITSTFSVETKGTVAASGLALFVYLNVLDSAFSLDGVVGAFALTSSIPVIAVGLGIGAYFVRSLTVYMVKQHTLGTLRYLEHGAHWAIFGLSASMFANLFISVPEIVTGTIGLVFLVAAYFSSLHFRGKTLVP